MTGKFQITRAFLKFFLGVLFFLALVGLFIAGITYKPPPTAEELISDERISHRIHPSKNLELDRKIMWRTVQGKEWVVSPASAINAASRVFALVDLKGKTTNEVFAILGHNIKSSNSSYHGPFFPVTANTLVYRFDCGSSGWQFNVLFDSEGRVTEVERLWIY